MPLAGRGGSNPPSDTSASCRNPTVRIESTGVFVVQRIGAIAEVSLGS